MILFLVGCLTFPDPVLYSDADPQDVSSGPRRVPVLLGSRVESLLLFSEEGYDPSGWSDEWTGSSTPVLPRAPSTGLPGATIGSGPFPDTPYSLESTSRVVRASTGPTRETGPGAHPSRFAPSGLPRH